jgi:hypothetical protein
MNTAIFHPNDVTSRGTPSSGVSPHPCEQLRYTETLKRRNLNLSTGVASIGDDWDVMLPCNFPDAELTNKLFSRQIVRPRCPAYDAHMETLRIVSGRPEFEHRMLRCSTCGLIHEVQVSADRSMPTPYAGLTPN